MDDMAREKSFEDFPLSLGSRLAKREQARRQQIWQGRYGPDNVTS